MRWICCRDWREKERRSQICSSHSCGSVQLLHWYVISIINTIPVFCLVFFIKVLERLFWVMPRAKERENTHEAIACSVYQMCTSQHFLCLIIKNILNNARRPIDTVRFQCDYMLLTLLHTTTTQLFRMCTPCKCSTTQY